MHVERLVGPAPCATGRRPAGRARLLADAATAAAALPSRSSRRPLPRLRSQRRPAPPPRSIATIVDTLFMLTNRERDARQSHAAAAQRRARARGAAPGRADGGGGEARARDPGRALSDARLAAEAGRLRRSLERRERGRGLHERRSAHGGLDDERPHRANILSARYTETGVGMARAKNGRVYSVQVFGRPR